VAGVRGGSRGAELPAEVWEVTMMDFLGHLSWPGCTVIVAALAAVSFCWWAAMKAVSR
jgi:hypothetical protein